MRHTISVSDVLDTILDRTILIAMSTADQKVLEYRVTDRAYIVKDNKNIKTTVVGDVDEAVAMYNAL